MSSCHIKVLVVAPGFSVTSLSTFVSTETSVFSEFSSFKGDGRWEIVTWTQKYDQENTNSNG